MCGAHPSLIIPQAGTKSLADRLCGLYHGCPGKLRTPGFCSWADSDKFWLCCDTLCYHQALSRNFVSNPSSSICMGTGGSNRFNSLTKNTRFQNHPSAHYRFAVDKKTQWPPFLTYSILKLFRTPLYDYVVLSILFASHGEAMVSGVFDSNICIQFQEAKLQCTVANPMPQGIARMESSLLLLDLATIEPSMLSRSWRWGDGGAAGISAEQYGVQYGLASRSLSLP